MIGLSSLLLIVAAVVALPVIGLIGFVIFAIFRYCPVISRNFEVRPLFQPLKLAPEDLGEEVPFPAGDGLQLKGSYFKARTSARVGVLVYCHEFLSDRWSYRALPRQFARSWIRHF